MPTPAPGVCQANWRECRCRRARSPRRNWRGRRVDRASDGCRDRRNRLARSTVGRMRRERLARSPRPPGEFPETGWRDRRLEGASKAPRTAGLTNPLRARGAACPPTPSLEHRLQTAAPGHRVQPAANLQPEWRRHQPEASTRARPRWVTGRRPPGPRPPHSSPTEATGSAAATWTSTADGELRRHGRPSCPRLALP